MENLDCSRVAHSDEGCNLEWIGVLTWEWREPSKTKLGKLVARLPARGWAQWENVREYTGRWKLVAKGGKEVRGVGIASEFGEFGYAWVEGVGSTCISLLMTEIFLS